MTIQRRLLYGFASLTAWYAGAGHALGLGELTLQSALSQPLQATIQVYDSDGVVPSDMVVALADAQAFAQAGIPRPLFLGDLRFTPVMENRQLVIRVESSQPVNEPYLSFLLQLKRANGSLLREYTLLLDPPLYQPAPVMASTQVKTPATANPQADSAAASATPVSSRSPTMRPRAGSGRYLTVAGDSLWSIAVATRPEHVPVQRQMEAIVALNPHAFVNGDRSRLRLGQELVLPDAARTVAVSAAPEQEPARDSALQEPAARMAEQPVMAIQSHDRLRLDEPGQPLDDEHLQLMERLTIVESRLRRLLGDLEERDAQLAELQQELDRARQAGALDALVAVSQLDMPVQGSDAPHAAPPVAADESQQAVAPAIEHPAEAGTEQGPRSGWIARWWPVPVALLAALLGALLLRSRRAPVPVPESRPMASPAPLPITIPGSRVVDPLEGVELYLAYGRLAEAAVMLDKAIADEPQRLDLRMRLLSVCAELGDMHGFARQEQELIALGAEQSQIDRVKAHHPELFRFAGRAEPSLGVLLEEEAGRELADLKRGLADAGDAREADLTAEPGDR